MTEIRCNDDGTLDEIVSDETTNIHLEQMDRNDWWLGIDTPKGRISVFLQSGKCNCVATVTESPSAYYRLKGKS